MTTRSSSWTALLLSAVAALGAALGYEWFTQDGVSRSQEGIAAPTSSGASAQRAPELLNATNTGLDDSAIPAARTLETEPPRLLTIRCRASEDGRTLEGVRAYRSGVVDPAASDHEGELELELASAGPLVLWKAGREPLLLERELASREVYLSPASASVEVTLRGMTLDHRLSRSLVLRRDVSTPEGPWSPELKQGALDVYTCAGLAAGSYDLYLWIQEGQGAPRPYELGGVELLDGQRQRLELDLDQGELEQEP